jgi:hypothetical protein
MAQQTAVEWAMSQIIRGHFIGFAEEFQIIYDKAKEMEKEQIKNAVIYALDEDGHTGDWKIKFINDYYNKTFKS